MRVVLSSSIEGDLAAISDYIAVDSPARAVSLIDEILAGVYRVARNPLVYRLRPEIGPGSRMAVVGRYVILFSVSDETVMIERIAFGGRDLPALLQ